MSEAKKLQKEAMQVLKDTSRTFYIPISLLEPTLKKTVASAYLCMRAIDEIEDHEQLKPETKQNLLNAISTLLKDNFDATKYRGLLEQHEAILPEVTLRLGDWITVCPNGIVEKVKESTSVMASGMADWARKDWCIKSKEELDDYTYYVAGLVGVMLSDIWKWYDNTETDKELAIAFGRGLQSVNILRNQQEDQVRGVSFMPDDWNRDDMFHYATTNLSLADEYMKDIKNRNILLFCKIPLALANKTLKALKNGREKISRNEVEAIVEQATK
ncbi:squalene/phytoene synthase family protein [Aquibacillus saliphilus]|uniref:squalene/phytoene synthase family protein n=1 Tax=Aquibacillus saliphilus TaxID=1909422 RepID=UPI001CF0AE91|nr:phytoene/squalene synthase family protein [Aquibacillus saliphilus]